MSLALVSPGITDMTDTLWVADADVFNFKDKIIDHYPELKPLKGIPIRILMTRKPLRAGGKRVRSKAQAFGSDLHHLLTAFRFVITLDERYYQSRADMREGVLYEALYACEVYHMEDSGDAMYGIRKPDRTGYQKVLERFPYLDSTLEQVELPLTVAQEREVAHA